MHWMEAISLELKIVFPCQLQVHVDKVDFVIMCADVDANVEYVELNVPFDLIQDCSGGRVENPLGVPYSNPRNNVWCGT